MDILNILLLASPFTFASDVPEVPETPTETPASQTQGGTGDFGISREEAVRRAIREYKIQVEDTELIEFAIMRTRVL